MIHSSLLLLSLLLAPAPNPDAAKVLATFDSAPITRADLMAGLPVEVQREYRSKLQQLHDMKARVVRDVIGSRGIAREAAERHVSEEEVVDADYETLRGEAEPSSLAEIAAAEEEIYGAEKVLVQRLIDEKRLASAAAAKNTTVDALTKSFESTIAPVTRDDVQFMISYEANRRRLASAGGSPEEQIERAIRATKVDQKKRQLVDSAAHKPQVSILVHPPRFKVSADDDPRRGPANAPVQIVMFSDFECQYCAMAEPVLARIRQVYGDRVAITFRDYPLPIHPMALTAAKAANCSIPSGKYWEFHDALFANQAALSAEKIREIAGSLGLDNGELARCFDAPQTMAEIEKDAADGRKLGVDSTPTFFINGRFLSGSQTFEKMAALIDDELRDSVQR